MSQRRRRPRLAGSSVGRWADPASLRRYIEAYDDALAGLPSPTRTMDTRTGYGIVRVLEWSGPTDRTPVLLLPGRSSGAPMWSENLPDWIGTRTVLAVDPLGDAGLSAQYVPLSSFEDQATWICETITALRHARAHVVGHSFGGASAAVHALRHPEQVASLTLLEPVMVVAPLPPSVFFWATVTQLPLPGSWRDRALAVIGGTSVEDVQARSPLSVMIDEASAHYRAAVPTPRTLTDQEWRSIRAPMRLDIGGRSQLAGGQQALDRIAELVPGARTRLWHQATHSLPMDVRSELGPDLVRFWSKHDA